MYLRRIYLFVLAFVLFGFSRSFAQYQIVLKNDTLVTDNQYDFDVFIKSDTGTINLTSYQIILTVNDSIRQGGTLKFSYIKGSSELTNVPDVHIGIVRDNGIRNLAAGSGAGKDTISTNYIRIGRFQISCTNPFGGYRANIGWDFKGHIESGINIDDTSRTNISDHINSLNNPLLVITGITVKKEVPLKFALSQNYPNPFNPTTDIQFTIPKAEKASLIIYNILGERVVTLVDGNMNAGTHTVRFNGSNLASGIYFYMFKAGDYTRIKKMILLK